MFVACVAAVAGSCRKDEDTTGPSVTILAPAEGATLQIPGELLVRVQVSDDNTVEALTISLTNADGVPVAPPAAVSVGSSSAVVERTLIVHDERLLSGNYTLIARASDGPNETRAFRTVAVTEAPLRRRAVFAICTPTSTSIQVHRIDSTGQVSLLTSFGQDFSKAAIRSSDKRLFLAGSVNGDLLAVDAENGSLAWQVANANGLSSPWFTALDVAADGRLYSATNDEFIQVRNALTGSQQFTTSAVTGFRARLTHVQDDEIVSEQTAIAGGERKLVTYSVFTGALFEAQLLDKDLVAMNELSAGHALLFGNRTGDGVVEDRNLATALATDVHTFSGDEIASVAVVGSGAYAVALASGIERFISSPIGSSPISTVVATSLAFDPANSVLFAASGSQVLGLDPNSGAVVESYTIPIAVQQVLVFLNR